MRLLHLDPELEVGSLDIGLNIVHGSRELGGVWGSASPRSFDSGPKSQDTPPKPEHTDDA